MKLNTKYLRDIRKSTVGNRGKALSREELAYEIDISTRTLMKLETQEDFNPKICTLYRLAKYFNVSLDNFVI